MRRKNVILICMIAVFIIATFSAVVMAKQSVVKTLKKKEIIEYIIVPNDTLWDISARFYGDPWLWPKIWEINEYIADPHWIYPDDKLKISLIQAHKQYSWIADKTYEVPPVILFDSTFRYDIQNNQIDMISAEKPENMGEIVDHIDDKILISEEDTVYFTMGKAVNVQIGDIFTVYRVDKKVEHPIKKKKLGYMVNLVGEIKTVEANVLKSGKIVYTGHILDSTSEMTVSDKVMPMDRKQLSITVKENSLDLSGYIIEEMEDRFVFGDHDWCFIDLGIKHGVKPGYSFSVYRKSKDEKTLPPYFIGNLIVLKVQDNNATCLVTNSLREMEVGDRIRSDITTELE